MTRVVSCVPSSACKVAARTESLTGPISLLQMTESKVRPVRTGACVHRTACEDVSTALYGRERGQDRGSGPRCGLCKCRAPSFARKARSPLWLDYPSTRSALLGVVKTQFDSKQRKHTSLKPSRAYRWPHASIRVDSTVLRLSMRLRCCDAHHACITGTPLGSLRATSVQVVSCAPRSLPMRGLHLVICAHGLPFPSPHQLIDYALLRCASHQPRRSL
ncbi:hypothetical protein EDB89DRAFT_1415569 [Lactarius sanguifluus]|nr:hypothetical protein EDB89DRAFT_1415569 [Lactarius sanguifluus]